jgi:hypothetical protein
VKEIHRKPAFHSGERRADCAIPYKTNNTVLLDGLVCFPQILHINRLSAITSSFHLSTSYPFEGVLTTSLIIAPPNTSKVNNPKIFRRFLYYAKKNNKYLIIKITFGYRLNNNTTCQNSKCYVDTEVAD